MAMAPAPNTNDLSCCPLCGGPNDCQLCTVSTYKGQCWCFSVEIEPEVLEKNSSDMGRQACLCRKCVDAANAASGKA